MIQAGYFLLLVVAAWRELPALWAKGARREAVVWAGIALTAALLACWLFWGPDVPGWAEMYFYPDL